MNAADRAARLRLLEHEIAQACVDWVGDTGECHLCEHEETSAVTPIPHSDDCPVGKLIALLDAPDAPQT